MAIVQMGEANITALVVPNVLIQLVAPRTQLLAGVPTDVVGVVGTASWGPVGVPVRVGSFDDQVRSFGPIMARARDLGTGMATAYQEGARNFRCVRATDGTDTAAQVVVPTDSITFTSRYSGSGGNKTKVTVSAGSRPDTWRATVLLTEFGFLPEIYDNVPGTGNALWVNLAEAINNGQYGVRSGSEIIIATAGAGTTAAEAATYTLAGGTDGFTGVTDATLVGSDTTPRSGMYALRGSDCSIAFLAEVVDPTSWPAQVTFARSEGIYMMLARPRGDTVAAAVTAKTTGGIDDQVAKVLAGDWCYWMDTTNGLPERLVSPQGFAAGRLANLSPERSGLNKRMSSIIGTQRTKLARPYSDADLQSYGQAGIDVITNPLPGGAYFGLRFGRNSSTNPVIRGDNHTRMTNYVAKTLERGLGIYVGEPNSEDTRRRCKTTLDAFYQAMFDAGMIEWFSNKVDEENNPENRRALGYLQADSQVRYLGIIEYLIANLEGGQSVQIRRVGLEASPLGR
jgi:uncharacterized protein